jgi:hypothetical protein
MKKVILFLTLIPTISFADIKDPTDQNLKGFAIVKSNKDLLRTSSFKETHDKDKYLDFFFNLEHSAPKAKLYAAHQDIMDTGLKNTSPEIKLSIPFSDPEILKGKTLGFAPIGTYKDGWTGIRIFFKYESLGTCSYSFEKFNYIEAESNYVKDYVHNKPTFTSIEGNEINGYLYTVSWNLNNFDSAYDYKLECVNKKNDKNIMEALINLANKIDR